MSVNEFEKQVQRQLDNFQLNPSASVWQKVEEEIREKKRRRVVFFILLPVALALLGFSIYQFWYPGKKTETAEQSLAATKKNEPANSTVATEAPQNSNGSSVPSVKQKSGDQLSPATNEQNELTEEKTITKERTITEEKTAVVKKDKVAARSNAEFSITNSAVGKKNNKETVKKNSASAPTQKVNDNTVVTTDVPSKQSNDVVNSAEVVPATDATKDVAVQPTVPVVEQPEIPAVGDNDATKMKKDSTKADNLTLPDIRKETIVKKKNQSKIKWSVDFATGLTFNNERTLSFARAEAFDMNYNYPGNVTGVGTSAPSNPPPVIIPPSTIKPGLSFKLGFAGEIKISKRSSFSAGLQYAYSSNRMKVGAVMDTAVTLQSSNNNFSQTRVNVDKLYTGAPQNNYINSYHFIQLPVSYHWQVNKSTRVPIRLNATAAVGYLLSTNALLYDGALGGIYYKDKQSYNKVHFNLGAGLSFGFRTKNAGEWQIGPDLSFDMSRLVKNDNQYLMFGGISTKWFIPKKKNK